MMRPVSICASMIRVWLQVPEMPQVHNGVKCNVMKCPLIHWKYTMLPQDLWGKQVERDHYATLNVTGSTKVIPQFSSLRNLECNRLSTRIDSSKLSILNTSNCPVVVGRSNHADANQRFQKASRQHSHILVKATDIRRTPLKLGGSSVRAPTEESNTKLTILNFRNPWRAINDKTKKSLLLHVESVLNRYKNYPASQYPIHLSAWTTQCSDKWRFNHYMRPLIITYVRHAVPGYCEGDVTGLERLSCYRRWLIGAGCLSD